jgi:hypothetical protein
MARRVQIVLDDDIDGGPAVETVSFALDGTAYEIDLSEDNAARLRDVLRDFIDNARTVSAPRRRGRTPGEPAAAAPSGGRDSAAVRQWAREQGIEVSQRGRIAADVIAKYDDAHG